MYLKNKYNISKTYKSFIRYFQMYRNQIIFELNRYERNDIIITEDELEEYVECKLLKRTWWKLFSILSIGEKAAIEVLSNRQNNFNPLCERLLQDAFDKWISIFFDDNVIEYYHKLDSLKIGMKMKIIREKMKWVKAS